MGLTKEQILTLTFLKGIGPKKILSIGTTINDRELHVDSYEGLHEVMKGMKDKKIQNVSLDDLNAAYRDARKTIEYSESKGIGLLGYYDEEFPKTFVILLTKKESWIPHYSYGIVVTFLFSAQLDLLSLAPENRLK